MTTPGEWNDPHALRANLTTTRQRFTHAQDTLRDHLTRHRGYIAWSGGKDSTAVVHLTTALQPDIPVVWFDSGIEYPETRDYIHHLAHQWELNLHTFTPRTNPLTILTGSGSFTHTPHSQTHTSDLHSVLVAEPSQRAHNTFGPGEITGTRAYEAAGRRALFARTHGTYERSDGVHVCAPVWNWSSNDIGAYLHARSIPENPVYQRLRDLGAPEWAQRVGVLVDGNAAEYGRFTWLRLGWPDLWSTLTEELPRLREWR